MDFDFPTLLVVATFWIAQRIATSLQMEQRIETNLAYTRAIWSAVSDARFDSMEAQTQGLTRNRDAIKALKESDAAALGEAVGKLYVERMFAGLTELDRWLDDRMRTGLADPALAKYSTWDDLAARLVDQPVIDTQPVSILEMRDKDANAPFFLGLVQRCIHFLLPLALVIKRRIPNVYLQRVPCLFGQHRFRRYHHKKGEGPQHPAAVFQPVTNLRVNDVMQAFDF